jgi:hypothetical protein
MQAYPTLGSCVYLLQEPTTSFYKIGRTQNIAVRLSALNIGRAVSLEVADLVHVQSRQKSVDIETCLHHQLKAYLMKGEWYELPTLDVWHDAVRFSVEHSESLIRNLRRSLMRTPRAFKVKPEKNAQDGLPLPLAVIPCPKINQLRLRARQTVFDAITNKGLFS